MYVILGRRKDGAPAYVGSSAEGHFFTDAAMDAFVVASPKSAKALLASIPRMSTYHRAETMDFGTFALHRAEIEMMPVAVNDDIRDRLATARSSAPAGWRFLVVDEAAERFATPVRHWSPSTSSLNEAVALTDLGGAVELLDRMGDGWRLVVGRVDVEPTPMSSQDLEVDLAEEVAAAGPTPDEDLSGQDVYVPRF